MKTLQAELPDKLYEQLKLLVKDGWFIDEKSVITEALRRFLETHKPKLLEKFMEEDIEWDCVGKTEHSPLAQSSYIQILERM